MVASKETHTPYNRTGIAKGKTEDLVLRVTELQRCLNTQSNQVSYANVKDLAEKYRILKYRLGTSGLCLRRLILSFPQTTWAYRGGSPSVVRTSGSMVLADAADPPPNKCHIQHTALTSSPGF